jgi:hypothetical protein
LKAEKEKERGSRIRVRYPLNFPAGQATNTSGPSMTRNAKFVQEIAQKLSNFDTTNCDNLSGWQRVGTVTPVTTPGIYQHTYKVLLSAFNAAVRDATSKGARSTEEIADHIGLFMLHCANEHREADHREAERPGGPGARGVINSILSKGVK